MFTSFTAAASLPKFADNTLVKGRVCGVFVVLGSEAGKMPQDGRRYWLKEVHPVTLEMGPHPRLVLEEDCLDYFTKAAQ